MQQTGSSLTPAEHRDADQTGCGATGLDRTQFADGLSAELPIVDGKTRHGVLTSPVICDPAREANLSAFGCGGGGRMALLPLVRALAVQAAYEERARERRESSTSAKRGW